MQSFPKPVRIGANCTRWRLTDLVAHDAARDGKPVPEAQPEAERYLSARQVAARYGTSVSTVWRWASLGAEGKEAA